MKNKHKEQPEFKLQRRVLPYESYSLWSRQLAKNYTVYQLQKVVKECEGMSDKYARQHLDVIKGITLIKSKRKEHTTNNIAVMHEKYTAYSDAIEIYKYYPERCKRLF